MTKLNACAAGWPLLPDADVLFGQEKLGFRKGEEELGWY
jgi:hypothetical protein